MDAQRLSFASASFDWVICLFSLMFIPDPSRAIREMLRVCRPDGVIVCSSWASMEWITINNRALMTACPTLKSSPSLSPSAAFALSTPERLRSLFLNALQRHTDDRVDTDNRQLQMHQLNAESLQIHRISAPLAITDPASFHVDMCRGLPALNHLWNTQLSTQEQDRSREFFIQEMEQRRNKDSHIIQLEVQTAADRNRQHP